MTTEEYINKAKAVHGDRFNYSKVNYINAKTPIEIICPEHGSFLIKPGYHLQSQFGCPKCARTYGKQYTRLTQEEFIRRAKAVWGDRYDLSKAVYKSTLTKLEIVCPKHGSFWTTPSNFIDLKHGCKKCAIEEHTKKQTFTKEKNLEIFKEVHGDKYDYSEVDFSNCKGKVKIICPHHGPFYQKLSDHRSGNGCPECRGKRISQSLRRSREEWINKAKEIHGDDYNYDEVEFEGNASKVKIYCNHCKKYFYQNAGNHLRGQGCPTCHSSKGESSICRFLEKNQIRYVRQKTFIGCKDKRPLRFDFYLPEHNVAIEYQGIQHYKPLQNYGGLDSFKERQTRDEIKRQYCYENDIALLEITYNQDIEKELRDYLK